MNTPNVEDTGSGAQTLQSGVGAVGGGAKDCAVAEPNPHDQKYRMGIGQRILGIANNFLQGMAHRDPVSYTGRGATNGRYALDMEAYRNGTLGRSTAKPGTSVAGIKSMGNAAQATAKGAGSLARPAAQPATELYDSEVP